MKLIFKKERLRPTIFGWININYSLIKILNPSSFWNYDYETSNDSKNLNPSSFWNYYYETSNDLKDRL